jgi:hypothetical protein
VCRYKIKNAEVNHSAQFEGCPNKNYEAGKKTYEPFVPDMMGDSTSRFEIISGVYK